MENRRIAHFTLRARIEKPGTGKTVQKLWEKVRV
jgi:hypothetical protein